MGNRAIRAALSKMQQPGATPEAPLRRMDIQVNSNRVRQIE